MSDNFMENIHAILKISTSVIETISSELKETKLLKRNNEEVFPKQFKHFKKVKKGKKCVFFPKGTCKFGDSCNFLHE